MLEDLGLAAALQQESRLFQERTGLRSRLDVAESLPALSRDAATAVFRICQEALTNVARHAEATEVVVSLAEQAEQLVLQVADNGRGIRAADLEDPKSLGLLGMKERAASLGGELTFQPSSPRGTLVKLLLPSRKPTPPIHPAAV